MDGTSVVETGDEEPMLGGGDHFLSNSFGIARQIPPLNGLPPGRKLLAAEGGWVGVGVWTSPSPTAVATIPPPVSMIVCSV
ncbi:MAG: hypothetical protein ACRDHG_11620 [Anaerolineales bacterium]